MRLNKLIFIILIILFFAVLIFNNINSKSAEPTINKKTTPTVTINGHVFQVETATTSAQQAKGLSNRKSLPEKNGMLFLFDRPSILTFWMKDMRFPIDIIFIKDNKVISIAHNAPPPSSPEEDLPVYSPEEPSDKVLEINAGLSKQYNIKKGDTIEFNL